MKSKLQKLSDKLDEVFGNYVRYRDKGVCITCEEEFDPSNRILLHPGHIWRRKDSATRWHEDNVFAQCRDCNFKQDRTKDNATALMHAIDRVGLERMQEVKRLTRTIYQKKVFALEDLIVYYQVKLEAAKNAYEGKEVSKANGTSSVELKTELDINKGDIQ